MRALRVKLVEPGAQAPAKMTAGSAGFDLHSAESVEVPPTRCLPDGWAEVGRALVSTGLVMELPPGTVGRVASRSGMSTKSNIETGAGWIDSDYRGIVRVELKNFSAEPYRVSRGDRIAQLVVLPLAEVELRVVTDVQDTGRGPGGFGSTGA